MNTLKNSTKLGAVLLFAFGIGSGCATADHGSAQANTNNYYGSGFNDPWYYGVYHDGDNEVVTPPPSGNPPDNGLRPTHPIARPPAARPPRPSIPTAPRPAPRPAMRR